MSIYMVNPLDVIVSCCACDNYDKLNIDDSELKEIRIESNGTIKVIGVCKKHLEELKKVLEEE